MRIAIIGCGYVGIVSGAGFAELGHEVACMDVDADRVAKLAGGQIPIHEPGLEELVAKHLASGRLRFTASLRDAAAHVDAVFICVPTPQGDDGRADTSIVERVARDLAQLIEPGTVIVNKSTVPVGHAAVVEQIIGSCAPPGLRFEIASNPEFLREGNALYDFMHPDRVVIGTTSERAIQVLTDLYRPLAAPVLLTNAETAELVKYASNAFLATKISFINAIARICETVGADVTQVALGMGYDPRIGFEFLRPGPGFGGSCLPKDAAALIAVAADRGYDFELLRGVLQINAEQCDIVLGKLERMLGGLEGARIAVWGLAFKANTDDVRGSPATQIVRALQGAGANLIACDPVVDDGAFGTLGVERAAGALDAADGADAVLILTEWDEFRSIDLQALRARMRRPVIVDARNLLDPDAVRRAGFDHAGIGR